MPLTGNLLIGQRPVTGSRDAIRAIDPATGQTLEPAYLGGTGEHVTQACALAWRHSTPTAKPRSNNEQTFLKPSPHRSRPSAMP